MVLEASSAQARGYVGGYFFRNSVCPDDSAFLALHSGGGGGEGFRRRGWYQLGSTEYEYGVCMSDLAEDRV